MPIHNNTRKIAAEPTAAATGNSLQYTKASRCSCQRSHSDVVALAESLGGTGGSSRLLELLGVTPAVHACIKMDEAAKQVSAAAPP